MGRGSLLEGAVSEENFICIYQATHFNAAISCVCLLNWVSLLNSHYSLCDMIMFTVQFKLKLRKPRYLAQNHKETNDKTKSHIHTSRFLVGVLSP